MNAPWKGSLPANRDPFAAFICDELTVDAIRPMAVEMGWAPEKVAKGGLRSAVQSLSIASSPAILMVDLSECSDPLNEINALAEVCEPGTVVIALGTVNDVRLYRDLLASGIHDYLLKPLQPSQIRDTLQQAQAIFTQPRPQEADSPVRHICTAIVGTRGGVGASSLATSLAWQFSSEHKKSTGLLDLDIHFGTDALALDLEPGRGLADAIDDPSRIDGLFLERATIQANERLSILSAESPISSPLLTDGSAFIQLEDEFRDAFDMMVIDMPRSILINFPHVLERVDVVVLVVEMTLASARDTIRLLAWLKQNAPGTQIVLVANKMQGTGGEISRSDFESSVERRINYAVPYDYKAAVNAAKLGQTLVAASPASRTTAPIREMAATLAAIGSDEDVKLEESGPVSLLSKFDLKSLLMKKEPRREKNEKATAGARS
ncbi:pilus assembly protein CpaE [Altericroceibacterium spongiae]|uniref:Pilus assembly protein CpaE n=1 Tax=Altericroceibacterium spongiae TaxID=2320269 RepID=A0A420EKD7_9SPHN|nr:pilus assembly protein CpaE [Altericroceibacterium spongiae]RKF21120.1 pilus assembly protein CpaE [Altericroceibacterium spongiae]